MLYIFANNIYYLSKSTFLCIIGRIVKQTFVMLSYTINLLHSTIPTPHSGCKNQYCWFHIHPPLGNSVRILTLCNGKGNKKNVGTLIFIVFGYNFMYRRLYRLLWIFGGKVISLQQPS